MIDGVLVHPDLNSTTRYILGYDAMNTGGLKDMTGHGTHVLGIAGAMSNNSTGIVGANWNSKFRISKVFDSNNNGNPTAFRNATIDAVNSGAKIINYSGGNISTSELYRDAIEYARNKDVLIIAAAGNNEAGQFPNGTYPARYANDYDNLISVTFTNSDDHLLTESPKDNSIIVAAPGWDIWSTFPTVMTSGDTYYKNDSGTSMAAPYVTGVASLMLSINPYLKPSQIKEIIMNTSEDLGSYGRDDRYGSGRLDAYRAVKAAEILNNYSNAKFKKVVKTGNIEVVHDYKKMILGSNIVFGKCYKLTVQYDLTQYMANPEASLYWFNPNGIPSGSTIYDLSRWCYLQKVGNTITAITYNFEYKDEMGNYMGWVIDPAQFHIDLLIYGQETGDLPATPLITKTEYIPIQGLPLFVPKISWRLNQGDGTINYEVERRLKYRSYADFGVWETMISAGSATSSYVDDRHSNGGTSEDLDKVQFRLRAKNSLGQYSLYSNSVEFGWDVLNSKSNANKGNDITDNLIYDYSLNQNFPNPFNPKTTITYSLKNDANVVLQIYDILGKSVATLVNERLQRGKHTAFFDASKLSSGMYFCKLTTEEFSKVIKMQLIK